MTPDPSADPSRRDDSARRPRVAILVGAEGPGLTEQAMGASDMRVRIPMSRGTDALNVATAAGAGVHDRVGRRWAS